MRQMIAILSIILTAAGVYKYRYKLLNLFLRQPMLRKAGIVLALRLPFVRQRLMGKLFAFPAAPPTSEMYKQEL